jgi:hypothetical protein
MNEIIGATLETAREHFINAHNDFYKFAVENGRESLEFWLDTTDSIEQSVRHAAVRHRIDNEEILEQISASLRFRVLAGILTRPVDYQDADETQGGICGCQEYDPEMGGWPCKVPGNQEQADAWHSRFGNSPACPFWENPAKRNPLEKRDTQIDKLLYEGEDLEDIWQQLGLKNKKH